MNSRQLSRGSSLFGTDPQVQLRTALRTNDFPTFKKLVSYGAVDLEYVNPYPDHKTCLELAICEPNKQEFVKLLLQHEVQVNKVNETFACAPIHFAVENGNIEALKALLDDDRIDVNIKSKGNTALLMAIKKIEDLEDDRERDVSIYEDMILYKLAPGGFNDFHAHVVLQMLYTAQHPLAERERIRVQAGLGETLVMGLGSSSIFAQSMQQARGRGRRG
ncbi:hypothetical protein MSG28_001674 [Choristoneura fumiferana]|uniref:Uncharacterized protein n=1 Tax=Choristoneura fumiferana TaxID=7141 RepID=A0ACC0KUQ7_CHOFU|nr:hypothetical protein MSG28_001674 [Choristoneura fumiferana]